MNKTKIEWADYTWNPVTGCLHKCPYCYAKKIAKRFGEHKEGQGIIELHWKRENPYPYDFYPTFHKYRLDEPARKTRSRKIFVCSMADLFGDWVPDEWIEEVFKICIIKAPHHKYLFLTKNPARYLQILKSQYPLCDYQNMWFGFTHTEGELWGLPAHMQINRFVSIEPLLGEVYPSPFLWEDGIDWVIIGQQTNPDKPPKDEWVQSIIDQCRVANVPVFVKSPLYEKFPIQEWPEGLRKEIDK